MAGLSALLSGGDYGLPYASATASGTQSTSQVAGQAAQVPQTGLSSLVQTTPTQSNFSTVNGGIDWGSGASPQFAQGAQLYTSNPAAQYENPLQASLDPRGANAPQDLAAQWWKDMYGDYKDPDNSVGYDNYGRTMGSNVTHYNARNDAGGMRDIYGQTMAGGWKIPTYEEMLKKYG